MGMEQELEEEEEVDPRIQVRTSWGPGCAPHPGPARAAAEVGVYTYPRFAAASVHDRGGGGARKPPSPLFGGCSARVDAAWLLRGSPRRPSMELGGSLQHAQRFRRLCNKGKKGGGGAGRVWGTLAWLVATRALYSLLATGCGWSGPRGRPHQAGWASPAPAAWAGTRALRAEPAPGGGARLWPPSYDALLAHLGVSCHLGLWWPETLQNPAFSCFEVGCEPKSGTAAAQS